MIFIWKRLTTLFDKKTLHFCAFRLYRDCSSSSSNTQQNIRQSSETTRNIAAVYENVITPEEELSLVKYLHPILASRRYEGAHWDAVISQYKEIELSGSYRLPPDINDLFERMRNLILEKCELDFNSAFLSPHVIDLAEDGSIGNHIDSIKFSGDFICGLSLISSRKMVLLKDREVSRRADTEEYPSETSLLLPARSLYILRGVWRYEYGHSILLPEGIERNNTPSNSGSNKLRKDGVRYARIKIDNGYLLNNQRRISVIFRNPLNDSSNQ